VIQSLKTKQFLTLLKAKIYLFFNRMMIYQFNLKPFNPNLEIPTLVQDFVCNGTWPANLAATSVTEEQTAAPPKVFKFYID